MSQNHSLKCKIDGPQSQIAKTPAEWKGDMKQGNKLQSVLVNLGKGKNQAQVSNVYQSIQYDVLNSFPHSLSHMPTNKYIKARFNLNAFLFIKI